MLEERGNIDLSFEFIKKQNIPNDAKVLEIGCRFGSLLYKLKNEAGFKHLLGVDNDYEAIKKGRSVYSSLSGQLMHYDGHKLPFNKEEFDVVIMFDVLEHIPEVKEFLLLQVNRVLKPNGIFVFQTPNKYTNIPWEVMQHKSFTAYKQFHCSLQTLRSLNKLLENSGFSHITIIKQDLNTAHNREKLKKVIGPIALPLLNLFQIMPLSFYPNFWGTALKK